MAKIESSVTLREAIAALEIRQAAQEAELRAELHRAYQGLRPVNLLRSTYEEMTSDQDLRSEVIDTVVSMAAGYASRKLLDHVADAEAPSTGAAAETLLSGAADMVRKNPEIARAISGVFFQLIRSAAQGIGKEEDKI